MTAQKIHFDLINADDTVTGAYCGAEPRGNATLTLSHHASLVTCKNCLRLMEDIADVLNADIQPEELEALELLPDSDLRLTYAPASFHRDAIAERHGLTRELVDAGFSAGFLKR